MHSSTIKPISVLHPSTLFHPCVRFFLPSPIEDQKSLLFSSKTHAKSPLYTIHTYTGIQAYIKPFKHRYQGLLSFPISPSGRFCGLYRASLHKAGHTPPVPASDQCCRLAGGSAAVHSLKVRPVLEGTVRTEARVNLPSVWLLL